MKGLQGFLFLLADPWGLLYWFSFLELNQLFFDFQIMMIMIKYELEAQGQALILPLGVGIRIQLVPLRQAVTQHCSLGTH